MPGLAVAVTGLALVVVVALAKTGSRDRAQATRYAFTHGYAEPARPDGST
jgi:hypothetical protein